MNLENLFRLVEKIYSILVYLQDTNNSLSCINRITCNSTSNITSSSTSSSTSSISSTTSSISNLISNRSSFLLIFTINSSRSTFCSIAVALILFL